MAPPPGITQKKEQELSTTQKSIFNKTNRISEYSQQQSAHIFVQADREILMTASALYRRATFIPSYSHDAENHPIRKKISLLKQAIGLCKQILDNKLLAKDEITAVYFPCQLKLIEENFNLMTGHHPVQPYDQETINRLIDCCAQLVGYGFAPATKQLQVMQEYTPPVNMEADINPDNNKGIPLHFLNSAKLSATTVNKPSGGFDYDDPNDFIKTNLMTRRKCKTRKEIRERLTHCLEAGITFYPPDGALPILAKQPPLAKKVTPQDSRQQKDVVISEKGSTSSRIETDKTVERSLQKKHIAISSPFFGDGRERSIKGLGIVSFLDEGSAYQSDDENAFVYSRQSY
jgi:hypothetical protein